MKKILLIPTLALALALSVFSGSALAGPPEGGGAPSYDGTPTSTSDGTIVTYGPPEGGG